MKLLALADLHSSRRALEAVLGMVSDRRPDAVVIAGDITSFGPAEFARELLSRVPVPALTVPGNCDPPDVARELSREPALNLSLRRVELGGRAFAGLAGWQVPPALHEWGFSPEDAARRLGGLMIEGDVLVTHVPPLGHLDVVPARAPDGRVAPGYHTGCGELARVVRRCRPSLVISGHIHEARGVEEDGGTVYLNPGPARDGFGALFELGRAGEKIQRSKIEHFRY